ncbi:MAG: Type 4 prepilin-like protein leader peptide-processing enzyme [Candidatus Uhrbacteria bacterium GW2011_GWE2_46_68]|uniref:Type 4 prepilin-like protein leader peptide-processing enzyme n=2 Tax=Candidatus Uhriibacteriota TaxID=1752732 RepID=A0A0G1Q8E0_9BACT|nr:MAG: Type 4 prepilin-like protein leader peptide-processing enzyme [Candidatus Uhrbacteria bacterium GW2011_GWF2_46_218]KKU41316.1 MAG: Type 4 prepilin-like protein leader peptide-processing enzyme [Candidatus Uhrbacteria bacterium GW2011_GWE2_46_68]
MVFIFFIGLCVGSFLNVIIVRTHENISIVRGRSICPFCHATLRFFDVIPVLSYLLLCGKCRFCHARIHPQYPLVELMTGVGFLLIYLRYTVGFSLPETFSVSLLPWFFVRDAFLLCVFLVIAVYDLRYTYILDRFILPALIALIPLQLFLGMSWQSLLAGTLVLGSFFGAQYFFSHGTWVGGGDIRLGILMGVTLGLSQGLFALLLAYGTGAFVAVLLLVTKKATRKTQIPFGPFLAGATSIVLFAGTWMMNIFFL